MMTRRSTRLAKDAGFTLPEVLIAIVIVSLVIGAISASLFALLRTQGQTTDRLVASRDAQLLGTWLPPDTSSAAITGWDCNAGCTAPPSGTCLGIDGTKVLHLPYAVSQTANPAQSRTIVDYRLVGQELVRYQCIDGGAASSRIVLARTLTSAAGSISCAGAPNCTSPIEVRVDIVTSQGLAATYTGDGRTGTTFAALPTVSVPDSTTTTLTPCVALTIVLNPTTVKTDGSKDRNGNPTQNSDTLSQDVAVTVTATGTCSGLGITYHPNPSDTKNRNLTGGPTSWTGTVPRGAGGGHWTLGGHDITVTGATNSISATLTVTQGP